jgi:spore coat protein CotH
VCLAASACTGQLHRPPGAGGDGGDGGDGADGGDDEDGGDACAGNVNQPPAAPAITSPDPGRIDVIPGDMVVEASVFSDPDGDAQARSEFAIWLTAGGEPVLQVWSAVVDDPSRLARVSLADGTFAVSDTLDDWADYQVVARYSDGDACGEWSEWSAPLAFRTDDGSSWWFAPDAVRDVYIEIPAESWDLIDAQAVPPGCVPYLRDYYTGSAVLDGQGYDGAGVRTKGGCGSARHLSGKASFKVNLSWNDPAVAGCPAERRSHGLKRLTLNNLIQDHSYVHERLAYTFYQLMGVPTPRASHVRLFVNDELWGLYLHVESIDRRFLSRWFDDNDGMLYEGTYYCDLLPGNVPPADEDTYCLSRKFRPSDCEPIADDGDPEDYTPLRAMVTQLDGLYQTLDADPQASFYPEIEAIFDFDTFLSMWAVETVIGHWDGYVIQIVNNYRVYHDPETARWTLIPTGVDQTFVQHTALGQLAGRLAQRCAADADCEAAFRARLAQAVDVFEQADLGALAQTIAAQIDPGVNEDPRKEISYDEFHSRVNDTVSFIDSRPAEIRAALGQ